MSEQLPSDLTVLNGVLIEGGYNIPIRDIFGAQSRAFIVLPSGVKQELLIASDGYLVLQGGQTYIVIDESDGPMDVKNLNLRPEGKSRALSFFVRKPGSTVSPTKHVVTASGNKSQGV